MSADCTAAGAPPTVSGPQGDLPTVEVLAASADNKLPDLTLRRLNCGPDFVNLKNVLPSDKPVLFWFWAPF